MENKKKRELILIAVILAIAAAWFIGNRLINRGPAVQVEVTIDGKVTELLDLNKDADIVIEGFNGGTNHLIIQDGEVWIEDASCPDKVCIHQGKIHRTGDIIVCLPNLMIAQIVGGED